MHAAMLELDGNCRLKSGVGRAETATPISAGYKRLLRSTGATEVIYTFKINPF